MIASLALWSQGQPPLRASERKWLVTEWRVKKIGDWLNKWSEDLLWRQNWAPDQLDLFVIVLALFQVVEDEEEALEDLYEAEEGDVFIMYVVVVKQGDHRVEGLFPEDGDSQEDDHREPVVVVGEEWVEAVVAVGVDEEEVDA